MAVGMKLWFRFREHKTPWAIFLKKMYCGAVAPSIFDAWLDRGPLAQSCVVDGLSDLAVSDYGGCISLPMVVWPRRYFASLFHVRNSGGFEEWKVGIEWAHEGHVREAMPCLIVCFLWTTRNDAKHRDLHWKGYVSVAHSLGLLVKMRYIHDIMPVSWIKPSVGVYKLNTDECSKGNPGISSYGAVVRDSSGHLVRAMHGTIGVSTNIRAELFAIWKGLQLCIDNCFFPIWLEVDSLIALQIIQSPVIEVKAAADHLANRAFDFVGDRVLRSLDIDRELFSICKLDRLDLVKWCILANAMKLLGDLSTDCFLVFGGYLDLLQRDSVRRFGAAGFWMHEVILSLFHGFSVGVEDSVWHTVISAAFRDVVVDYPEHFVLGFLKYGECWGILCRKQSLKVPLRYCLWLWSGGAFL
ncbi:hypothetical protein ZIOFF_069749 [Zingiber officinale]|uniref:RNase H type-1 domain-containing protein n=1 Tax=Zingiber officinale TaxID=94328 RepID=A0A8J5CBM4_ZINOF|nr:hypothetical protein ZIOFF_069749 [Zingiber officinale]